MARALLNPEQSRQWGRDIARRSGVESGSVHPVLQRMVDAGWLEAWREAGYRYYEITPDGRTELEALVARARDDARFTRLFPR